MRNVTVNSVEFNTKKVIATDVTTYGELKSVLMSNDIHVDGKSVIVAQTKVSLEIDSAMLPEGDFTLMIFPKTFKAGFYDSPEDYEGYSNSEIIEELEEEIAQIVAKLEVLRNRINSGTCIAETTQEDEEEEELLPQMSDEDQELADQLKKELGL
jgi:hypothetical protein